MKFNLIFTAEINDALDIPEEKQTEILSEEENKKILEECLREICSDDAEIIIHDFKFTTAI